MERVERGRTIREIWRGVGQSREVGEKDDEDRSNLTTQYKEEEKKQDLLKEMIV
jgi:hypothetical protein